MKTFLRALFVRTPFINPLHALAVKRLRLMYIRRALCIALLLCAPGTGTSAQDAKPDSTPSLANPAAISSWHRPERKRLVTLRRNETTDGSRLTLTSDAPLADYRSFAEADRVCVLIPQAAFVSQRRDERGPGFADMRIEQREQNVMLSFRLQQGATVAVNQNFNRLDIAFTTNERANSARPD